MSLVLFILFLLAIILPRPTLNSQFDRSNTNRLQGILAILIVFYHTTGRLVADTKWGIVIVSLFFFISGYGLMASYDKIGETYLQTFFRKKFKKLLPPLILMTIGYMALFFVLQRVSISYWGGRFIDTGIPPIGATWYVYCAIILYVLFYIVMRIGRNRKIRVLMLCTLLGLLAMFISQILEWDDFWWCSTFAFVVGVIYQLAETRLKILFFVQKHARARLALFFILLSAIYLCYLITRNTALLYTIINLIPVAVVFVVYQYGIPCNRTLVFLGSISYQIYLVHDVYIACLYKFHIQAGLLRFFIVLILTVPTAVLLKKFSRIITNRL